MAHHIVLSLDPIPKGLRYIREVLANMTPASESSLCRIFTTYRSKTTKWPSIRSFCTTSSHGINEGLLGSPRMPIDTT